MRIGELSEATGASTRALRYYEEQGLVSSERLPNGYRDYGPEAVERVQFIQDLLGAGLSSKALRDVTQCISDAHDQAPCTDVIARVRQVREDLLDQEQRIRTRREMLDEYLSGQRSPRGGSERPRASASDASVLLAGQQEPGALAGIVPFSGTGPAQDPDLTDRADIGHALVQLAVADELSPVEESHPPVLGGLGIVEHPPRQAP